MDTSIKAPRRKHVPFVGLAAHIVAMFGASYRKQVARAGGEKQLALKHEDASYLNRDGFSSQGTCPSDFGRHLARRGHGFAAKQKRLRRLYA